MNILCFHQLCCLEKVVQLLQTVQSVVQISNSAMGNYQVYIRINEVCQVEEKIGNQTSFIQEQHFIRVEGKTNWKERKKLIAMGKKSRRSELQCMKMRSVALFCLPPTQKRVFLGCLQSLGLEVRWQKGWARDIVVTFQEVRKFQCLLLVDPQWSQVKFFVRAVKVRSLVSLPTLKG